MDNNYENWINEAVMNFSVLSNNYFLKKVMNLFLETGLTYGTNGTYYYYGDEQHKVEIRRNMYYKQIGLFKVIILVETRDRAYCKISVERVRKSENNCKRSHDISNYLDKNATRILGKNYIIRYEDMQGMTEFESDLITLVDNIETYYEQLDFLENEEPLQLQKIGIYNFKSIQQAELKLNEKLQVLVGVNNAGKTSFMQGAILAYRALDRLFEESRLSFDTNGHLKPSANNQTGVRVKDIPFVVDNYKELFNIEVDKVTRPVKFCRLEFQNNVYIELSMILIAEVFSIRLSRCSVGIKRIKLDRFLQRSIALIPSFFTVTLNEERKSKGRYNSLLKTGNYNLLFRNILIDLKEYGEDDSSLDTNQHSNLTIIHNQDENVRLNILTDSLKSIFNIENLSVKFDPQKDEFIKASYSAFREDGTEVEMDISSLGMGTLQFIQVVAQTLIGMPFLILIDEPDAHLNSSLQQEVMNVFNSLSNENDVHFLISTHSKDIINCVSPKQIMHLNTGNITEVQNLEQVIEVFKEIGASTEEIIGISLGKRLILLEGEDDIEYIKALCESTLISENKNFEMINFLEFGGRAGVLANQLDKYVQFNFDEIQKIAVFDRDYRFLETHLSDADKLRNKGFNVIEWTKKELENYLIIPTLIIRVLNDKYDVTIDEVSIQNKILEYCEEKGAIVEFEIEKQFELLRKKELSEGIRVKNIELSKEDELKCKSKAKEYIKENELINIFSGKEILEKIRIDLIHRNTPTQKNFVKELIINLKDCEIHEDVNRLLNSIRELSA